MGPVVNVKKRRRLTTWNGSREVRNEKGKAAEKDKSITSKTRKKRSSPSKKKDSGNEQKPLGKGNLRTRAHAKGKTEKRKRHQPRGNLKRRRGGGWMQGGTQKNQKKKIEPGRKINA